MSEQPEFDFGDGGGVSFPAVTESSVIHAAKRTPPSPWHEVPQARFLSWSPQMQYAYCAARDLASAETAYERGEDPEFYQQRAESYAVEALR
jgi:hypothetical protein